MRSGEPSLPIAILAMLVLIAPAVAQAPVSSTPASAAKPAAKPVPPHAKRPANAKTPAAPAPATPAANAVTDTAATGHEPDLVFGAFQRGYYLSAFDEATRRVDQKGDMSAMTMLGELYSQGLGVPRDDNKAAEWYRLAADRGDRNAMFALAMFRFTGRAGPIDRTEAARLLAAAAKLGHAVAAYDLGLLYLEGQQFPKDFNRAAELFRTAANAGNAEAQYALATLQKQKAAPLLERAAAIKDEDGEAGRRDKAKLIADAAPFLADAAQLLGAAAQAENLDAMVEYAIAVFNGTGTAKDETAAAGLFLKAARIGSPIAQNRLARILAIGRGVPADPVQAVKWHLIARAAGNGDPFLDEFMQRLAADVREAGQKLAQPWLDQIARSHS